jgi:hypothetical protein
MTTAGAAARSAAVPRGLEIAAAWAWRVILVVILLWGIAWLVRYLSEVFIPIAVAILLTALMVPATDALRKGKWGLPRAAATAITVIGAVALLGTVRQRRGWLLPTERLAEQWPADPVAPEWPAAY